jgi:azurin
MKSKGALGFESKIKTPSITILARLIFAVVISISIAHSSVSQAALQMDRKVAATAPKPLSIQIGSKGDELAFDKTTLNAKPGQSIKLTFKNKSAKDSGLQHNWVLVNPGTADSVGQDSLGAGPEKGYIADSPNILAHTKLVNAGESETIEFKAPSKAGEYPYICTFPGHYTVMKGVLKVK